MTPALIAEIGLAHEGSLWLAHSYLDACADAGATHVKFQAHHPDESSEADVFRQPPPTGESRRDYWRRTAFTPEQWAALHAHAGRRNVKFGLSIFHYLLAKSLEACVDFLKVPSGAATHRPLLDAYAATRRPVYVSDGLHRGLSLPLGWTRLVCTSEYPCPMRHTGLSEIRPGVDGFSDHSGEPLTAALATYAGAVAVEVHVTFDRRTGLPDASSSLTVDGLREARRLMGLAAEARFGQRPAPSPEMQRRYGYAWREGAWSKPA